VALLSSSWLGSHAPPVTHSSGSKRVHHWGCPLAGCPLSCRAIDLGRGAKFRSAARKLGRLSHANWILVTRPLGSRGGALSAALVALVALGVAPQTVRGHFGLRARAAISERRSVSAKQQTATGSQRPGPKQLAPLPNGEGQLEAAEEERKLHNCRLELELESRARDTDTDAHWPVSLESRVSSLKFRVSSLEWLELPVGRPCAGRE